MLCLLEQCIEVIRELMELVSTVPHGVKKEGRLLLPKECPRLVVGEEGDNVLQCAVEELSVSPLGKSQLSVACGADLLFVLLQSLLPGIRSMLRRLVRQSEDEVLCGISSAA